MGDDPTEVHVNYGAVRFNEYSSILRDFVLDSYVEWYELRFPMREKTIVNLRYGFKDYIDCLLENESKVWLAKNFLSLNFLSEIEPKDRALLVNRMIEYSSHFDIENAALYTAVHILDQYLNCSEDLTQKNLEAATETIIKKENLHAIGIAAMSIGCKVEMEKFLKLDQYCALTDNEVTINDVNKCERKILKKIDWFVLPIHYYFLEYFVLCMKWDEQHRNCAYYLAEMTLMDTAMVFCPRSELAASAMFLTCVLLETEKLWTKDIERNTGYSRADLAKTFDRMHTLFKQVQEKGRNNACFVKYARRKWGNVSQVLLFRDLYGKAVNKTSREI